MRATSAFAWPFVFLHNKPICCSRNPEQVFLWGSKGMYKSTDAGNLVRQLVLQAHTDTLFILPAPHNPAQKLPSASVDRTCGAVRDIKLCLITMQAVRSAGQEIRITKAITVLSKTWCWHFPASLPLLGFFYAVNEQVIWPNKPPRLRTQPQTFNNFKCFSKGMPPTLQPLDLKGKM